MARLEAASRAVRQDAPEQHEREPTSPRAEPALPISVCVMACNDEHVIERCLESVAFAEDVVVALDSASSDRTGALARRLATRTDVHRYAGDIEQKRYVTSLARFDWVLSVDSDEVVSPELAAEIRALFAGGTPRSAGYEVNRVAFHLGRWIRHGDWHPDWKLRLFHAPRARWVGNNPHGRAEVEGSVARLAGDLEHYSYRDFSDQVDRIHIHTSQAADALFVAGRRAGIVDLTLRPLARFLRGYVLKRGFLDGMQGLIVAGGVGFSVFLKYAKLWERERRAHESDAHDTCEGGENDSAK
jgi:glycosyltransferase involved in cell wall biosynthesis